MVVPVMAFFQARFDFGGKRRYLRRSSTYATLCDSCGRDYATLQDLGGMLRPSTPGRVRLSFLSLRNRVLLCMPNSLAVARRL